MHTIANAGDSLMPLSKTATSVKIMMRLMSITPGAFAPVHVTCITGRNFIGFMYEKSCSINLTMPFHRSGRCGIQAVNQRVARHA